MTISFTSYMATAVLCSSIIWYLADIQELKHEIKNKNISAQWQIRHYMKLEAANLLLMVMFAYLVLTLLIGVFLMNDLNIFQMVILGFIILVGLIWQLVHINGLKKELTKQELTGDDLSIQWQIRNNIKLATINIWLFLIYFSISAL